MSEKGKPPQEFVVGQKVRIIRQETWQGRICTITQVMKREPKYWLKEHGWRCTNEIEAVSEEEWEGQPHEKR